MAIINEAQASPQGAPPAAQPTTAPVAPGDTQGAPQGQPGTQAMLSAPAIERLRRLLLAAMKVIYADPQVSRGLVDMVMNAQNPQEGLQHATGVVLERIAKAGVDPQLLERLQRPVAALIAELVQAASGGADKEAGPPADEEAAPGGGATAPGGEAEAPAGGDASAPGGGEAAAPGAQAEPDEGLPEEEKKPDEEEEA